MPLGADYTAEEQITGQAEYGGTFRRPYIFNYCLGVNFVIYWG
jgi:hypothetical protein